MQQDSTQLREYWLQQATFFLFEHIQRAGLTPVPVRVSCGWPSSGGLGLRRVTIGQCFAAHVCKDGIPQIFVSPRLDDSVEVLGTLLHELLHAILGARVGHGKAFSQAARKVGLDGPPTATVVGEPLKPLFHNYIAHAGKYPHAAILPSAGKNKAGSRLRLYECSCEQPVKVRVANNTFQAVCLVCEQPFTLVVKSE